MGLKAKYETGVVLVIWENGGGRKGRKLELLRAMVPRKSQTKKRSREPGDGKMAQQSRAPASLAEDPRGVPSTSLVALKHLLFKFQRLQCSLLAPVVTYVWYPYMHAAKTLRHKIKTNKSEKENTPKNQHFLPHARGPHETYLPSPTA